MYYRLHHHGSGRRAEILHFASQSGLITDGMFRFVRHPNYCGEMIIYGSFALMIWHWIPLVILSWTFIGVFVTNMIMKERSMARCPAWTAYRSNTWRLIPGLL